MLPKRGRQILRCTYSIYIANMSEKIIISKPSINVGTVTDPNDIIFSSDYQTLRYDTSGTYGLAWAQSGTYHEYSHVFHHNLGYTPFFMISIDPTSSGVYYPS